MSSINRESYLLVVTSNDEEKTFRFILKHSQLKALVIGGILSLFFVFAVLFDYINLIEQSPRWKSVKAQYEKLNSELIFIYSELRTLEAHLNVSKDLTHKIEIINSYYTQGPEGVLTTQSEFSADDIVAEDATTTNTTIQPKQKMRGELFISLPQILPHPIINKGLFIGSEELSGKEMARRIDVVTEDSLNLEQKVLRLWENLSERQNFIRATPSIKPAVGWFTSPFGIRADPFTGRPTMHAGLDIAGNYGEDVLATADGVVSFVGWRGGYGNLVTIDHGYGVQTRYGHLSKAYVKVGEPVKRFERVAAMGNTGRSTNTHVHYEVRIRGVAVNPINYILTF